MSGTKHDDGKPPIDLVPTEMIVAIAKVLGFGAKKYSRHNWRGGIAYSRVYSALQRHLMAWQGDEKNDSESGLPHLWHAACCLSFLITYEEHDIYTHFDDRHKDIGIVINHQAEGGQFYKKIEDSDNAV